MTRVRCSTAAVLLLAATLLPGVAKAETVRIARQFGISYLPLVLMQEAGLLEQEGRVRGLDLTVDWISFTGGPPINDALISGSIDLAAGGVGPMLTLWGRTRANLRVKGIAALCSMPIWLNTNNPAVRTIADFTERDRIALPGVKVSIQAVVLQMAALQAFGTGQQNRLDPLTVSMGHPDGQAALLGARTEITAHFTAAPYMYAEAASPEVHRVLDSYDVLGGPQPSTWSGPPRATTTATPRSSPRSWRRWAARWPSSTNSRSKRRRLGCGRNTRASAQRRRPR